MATSSRGLDEWSPLARVYSALHAGSIDGTDTEPHDRGIVRSVHTGSVMFYVPQGVASHWTRRLSHPCTGERLSGQRSAHVFLANQIRFCCLFRAMTASYKPNHLVEGDPKSTLFVARLHPETTEDTLTKLFGKYGHVSRVRLVRDVVTGFSKRYAFVEYEKEDDARYAFRNAQNIDVDGVTVYVDYEIERTLKGWVPRRLGGGFGGRKESGQLRFGGRDRPFRKPILVTRDVTDAGRDVLRLPDGGEDSSRHHGEQSNRYHGYRNTEHDRGGRDRGWRSDGRDHSRRDYRDHRDRRDHYSRNYGDRDRGRGEKESFERHRDRRRSRSR